MQCSGLRIFWICTSLSLWTCELLGSLMSFRGSSRAVSSTRWFPLLQSGHGDICGNFDRNGIRAPCLTIRNHHERQSQNPKDRRLVVPHIRPPSNRVQGILDVSVPLRNETNWWPASDFGRTDGHTLLWSCVLATKKCNGISDEMCLAPMNELSHYTLVNVYKWLSWLSGIPTVQQHLIYQTAELEDDYCLHDYNVNDGATLKLVLAMRGGPINTRRSKLDVVGSWFFDWTVIVKKRRPTLLFPIHSSHGRL